ncbi:MAG: hypothetical protein ABSH32_02060 [Bryobacteraceae bacterium]|jgi:hypothetical protein
MEKDTRFVVGCCVAIIAALLVVGVVSHIVIRHVVQTSVLWIAIVLGIRNSKLTKWAALPCFVFWLVLMAAIWSFLLGWTAFLSGTFSPTEIAMTIIVGLASLGGMIRAVSMKSAVRAVGVTATVLVVLILQVAAFRLSMLPEIARR